MVSAYNGKYYKLLSINRISLKLLPNLEGGFLGAHLSSSYPVSTLGCLIFKCVKT